MITAVDSSVLSDVFRPEPTFGPRSKAALHRCWTEGTLIACEVVWAEVVSLFSSADAAEETMNRLGVEFSSTDLRAALAAGSAWKLYRSRGGQRQRVIADFLIGAHALSQAERLLTRDRGFYRAYFSRLKVLDPTKV